jgi:hypothetical protein
MYEAVQYLPFETVGKPVLQNGLWYVSIACLRFVLPRVSPYFSPRISQWLLFLDNLLQYCPSKRSICINTLHSIAINCLKNEFVVVSRRHNALRYPNIIVSRDVTSVAELTNGGNEDVVNSTIKHIRFQEGCQLRSIGESACVSLTRLKSIVIPEGVESIEKVAFAECFRLKSVETANLKVGEK